MIHICNPALTLLQSPSSFLSAALAERVVTATGTDSSPPKPKWHHWPFVSVKYCWLVPPYGDICLLGPRCYIPPPPPPPKKKLQLSFSWLWWMTCAAPKLVHIFLPLHSQIGCSVGGNGLIWWLALWSLCMLASSSSTHVWLCHTSANILLIEFLPLALYPALWLHSFIHSLRLNGCSSRSSQYAQHCTFASFASFYILSCPRCAHSVLFTMHSEKPQSTLNRYWILDWCGHTSQSPDTWVYLGTA